MTPKTKMMTGRAPHHDGSANAIIVVDDELEAALTIRGWLELAYASLTMR